MRHLPNLITLGNLFCGCLAITSIFNAKLEQAGVFILLALLLDFLDGFAARALKANSALGKQLDSLADMVSFGVVPGMMLYTIFFMGSASSEMNPQLLSAGQHAMFLVTLFSCLRLARFNIDTRQSNHFIGLPTPANTLMIMSFPFILGHDEFGLSPLIYNPLFLLALSLFCSWLLIAEIPLLALKFRSFRWKDNRGQYTLLAFSALLLLFFRYAAPPLIILFYVILSLIFPPEKISK
ncbi:MAG: CDP-diacylglycerol--serine O-phosphatidyltransferase [Bacteroidia bacterium]|nr:CDP-diacylglycerol--serine O-phosphatidyltransferase [Bacteroidia bacterium]